jgi:simple sugar transport system ATP-binding protein
VIFITHKLKEALRITDRITVLRKGKNVATVKSSETDEKELARLMVGEEISMEVIKPHVEIGGEVLRMENLWARNDRGIHALRGVNLSLRRGEILGLAGVSGNGQKELEEVLAGVRKPEKGRIILNGKDITNLSAADYIRLGIACIPEDRLGAGIAPNLSVMENIAMRRISEYGGVILDYWAMEEDAKRLVEEFGIRTPSVHVPASTLSGGNIQRLILARELSRKPEIIIASQPTRGLDVAGAVYVRNRLVEEARRGSAILLISEDLDEIMQLSDRIAVIYEGEIRGVIQREEATLERIGYLMAGGTA